MFRPTRTEWKSGVAAVLALGACTSDPNSIAEQAKQGDQKGYIAGNGSIEQIPVDKRLKPVTLEGYGEIPPVTKWLPYMPAPLNYFGIWVPKGTPEPVVQTMDMIWKKKIANSEPLKKYAAARAALFTPISGAEAEKEATKMVTQTVWLYFDAGKAKASPDTIGIARPQ